MYKDWLYLVICFVLYFSYNEAIAYSGFFVEYQQWSQLFVAFRVFTYLLNSLVLYIFLFRIRKLSYFLIIHVDVVLFSLDFFYDRGEAIIPLAFWCVFRYGFWGIILYESFISHIAKLPEVLGFEEVWMWFLMYGVGGYVLLIVQMLVIHILTSYLVDIICRFRIFGCR